MDESPKKTILIVTHHYPPHITGVGMVAQNHAKRFAALGHDVTVITSKTAPEEKSYFAEGINVIRINAWNISENWGAPFPIFSPILLFVAWKAVKNADIVHIHDAFYMSSFFVALFAWWKKKPIILTQHVAMIAHPSRLIVAIEKITYATTGALIFRLSNVIFTFNGRVKQFLLDRGVSESKIVSLSNGVDTSLFRPVSQQEKQIIRKEFNLDLHKKIILFVGRFVPKKGFDKVLAARSEEYQIVCAGGVPKEELDNILFLGKLDQETLARVYQAVDIFLLPSESEGFPLSMQEAMASGLPIITTDDEGYDHYKLDKKLIYFLKDATSASVKSAIQDIIHDDKLLKDMGDYSRNYAQDNFNWQLIISRINKTYNTLLVKKKLAIVSDAVYPFNTGGKEKRLYDITTRLALHKYNITIYCMQWWEGPKIIMRQGVTLHAISPYYPLYTNGRRSIKEAVFFALNCLKLINKKFDVIEVDHMPQLVLFTVKIVCFFKHKHMIAVWHEVWGKTYWRRYLGLIGGTIAYYIERISAQLPDTIISVSNHTTDDLRSILKTEKKILTIPNGLDIKSIKNDSTVTAGADIIFAGRLLGHKNVDVLLRATAILKKTNPKISALIVGDGPEKNRLELLAEELGLQSNVAFVDFFENHKNLYSAMRGSRVFVLPSTREGFGIMVIEANACGLPVITIEDEHNAAKDLIVKNENGALCVLDENQLATTIEKVMSLKKDASFYLKYSEQYDWTYILPKIENLYI